MSYITYLEHLPKLDESLLQEAIYSKDNHPNIFVLKNHPYKLYAATPKLQNFVNTFLDCRSVGVHAYTETIPIHTDISRSLAYNYIFDPGGPNVLTSFYDINDFTRNSEGRLSIVNKDYKPIASYSIRPNVWHLLDVSVPHGVSNIETVRFAITATPN